MPTVSEFRFAGRDNGQTTLCSERIEYACPWLMAGFCEKEVAYQREKIRENLRLELYNQNQ